MNLKFAGIGLTLLAALLTGCSSKPEDTAASPTNNPAPVPNTPATTSAANVINGAGATFPKPIYEKWIAKYQPTASVNYQAVGSGKGIDSLKTKTVAFGASDAPLSETEEKDIPNAVHIPTVGGAVVLTYNVPGAETGLHFTPETIAGIYLGKIKKWNDPAIVAVNPGKTLPDLNILPVHRNESSGTTYIFTNYLKKASTDWAAGPGAGKSIKWPIGIGGDKSDGVATQVTRTPGAIGYVELAYAIKSKLPYGAVKNKAGNFITPDVESTQAALADYADALAKDIKTPTVDAPGPKSYPICSVTYVLLVKQGGTPDTVAAAKFWEWALQPEQQSMAKELYYAPLPDALVKMDMDALKAIEAGK